MTEFIIDVAKVEELQMINDVAALDKIFSRAKSTVVQGEAVILARKLKTGVTERFAALTTVDDLESYRQGVYKFLH